MVLLMLLELIHTFGLEAGNQGQAEQLLGSECVGAKMSVAVYGLDIEVLSTLKLKAEDSNDWLLLGHPNFPSSFLQM
jgi:hypothetical protein